MRELHHAIEGNYQEGLKDFLVGMASDGIVAATPMPKLRKKFRENSFYAISRMTQADYEKEILL